MMVANVLLLNLLIAMFSRTYEKVESEAEDVANLLQYELIMEYYFKPVIPVLVTFTLFKPPTTVEHSFITDTA